MGMTASIAHKGQACLAYMVRAGKNTLSYLARIAKPGLECVSSRAKVPLDFVKHHSQGAKIVAGTLAASGLAYVAGRTFKRLTNPPAAQDPLPAEDFQDALNEWLDQERSYEEQVENVKRRMLFFVPMAIGARILYGQRARHVELSHATVGALGQAADVFGLMRTIFDIPTEYCVRCLSYIPSPAVLNALRANRIRAKKAWENVKKIIREEEITLFDLNDAARQMHIEVAPKAQLRNYISEISEQDRQAGRRARRQANWIGKIPREIAELIEQVREYCAPQVRTARQQHDEEALVQYSDITLPRGVFMLGVPGVGKSFAAELIGQETDCYVDVISATDIFGMYVGDAKKNVKALYKKAAERAARTGKPAFVFIDEADSLLGARSQQAGDRGHGAAEREALNTLLPLLDGPKAAPNVITIFASNSPRSYFDKAVYTRTKRVRYFIQMGPPDEEDTLAMLAHAANKYPQTRGLLEGDGQEILRAIAREAHTRGFVADNLYGIIDQAVDFVKNAARERIEHEYAERLRNNPDNDQLQAAFAQAKWQERRQAHVTRVELDQAILDIDARRREGDDAHAEQPAAPAAVPAGQAEPAAAPAAQVPVAPVVPVPAPAPQAAAIPEVNVAQAHASAIHQVQPPVALGEIFEHIVQQNQTLLQLLQRQFHPEQAAPAQPAAAQMLAQHAPVVAAAVAEPVTQAPLWNLAAAAAINQHAAAPRQVVGRPNAGRQRSNSLLTDLQTAQGFGLGRNDAIAALRAGTGPVRQMRQAH